MQPECAHDEHSSVMRFTHGGVQIRYRARSKLEIFSTDAFDFDVLWVIGICAPGAGFEWAAITAAPSPRQFQMPVTSMRAKRWTEGSELKPTRVQFGSVLGGWIETTNVAASVRTTRQTGIDCNWYVNGECFPATARVT